MRLKCKDYASTFNNFCDANENDNKRELKLSLHKALWMDNVPQETNCNTISLGEDMP